MRDNIGSKNLRLKESFVESVPVELFDSLLDAGGKTAIDYLKENKAPEQLIDLISWVIFYSGFVARKRINNTQPDNEMAFDGIPEVTQSILDLGGDLTGETVCIHYEPVRWKK